MKMRKLISLVSSLAIVLGMFTTVAFAANGAIDLSVEVDGDGYYYVDFTFDVPDVTMDIAVSKTEGRNTYYSGTGVFAGQLNFPSLTSADLYTDLPPTAGFVFQSGVKDGELVVSFTANTVKEMIAEDASGSATFLRLNTNYSTSDKTAEEIEAMFSDISYMNVKLVTVAEHTAASANPASSTVVTYATYDGDFGCELKGDEPAPVVTATVVGYFTGDKTEAGNDDESDKAAAIVGTPVEKTDATSLVWTVTSVGDETQTFTQAVDVSGGATYKFGLVLRNITKDFIKTVSSVLQ
jgi:hypothetical protein